MTTLRSSAMMRNASTGIQLEANYPPISRPVEDCLCVAIDVHGRGEIIYIADRSYFAFLSAGNTVETVSGRRVYITRAVLSMTELNGSIVNKIELEGSYADI